MAGATRRPSASVRAQRRAPVHRAVPTPQRVGPLHREINVAWASITAAHIAAGELVFNANDGSLVYRRPGSGTIHRYDEAATRTL